MKADNVQILAGTSGYSYKEWKGSFYPEKLPAKDMLSHYAERLPAVEINNTFYRMPRRSVLEAWVEQVPAGFRFAVKASRRITHNKRLAEASEETTYLLSNLEVLGDRLGVVLFQLPPGLRKDTDRLRAFQGTLPPGLPVTFEFRHASWYDDEVCAALREHGHALCIVDGDDGAVPDALPATAPWGYLRLRRLDYDANVLERWVAAVAAQDWRHAFVFFKHEDAGAGPELAQRFIALSGC